jgi:DNA primase
MARGVGEMSRHLDVDTIRDAVTMVDVLTAAGYDAPTSQGFICCPNHSEKTPSCKVYRDHVYCYGCAWHADAFTLAMALHKVPFKQALAHVARLAGYSADSAPRVDMAAANARIRAKRERQQRREWWREELNMLTAELGDIEGVIRACARLWQQGYAEAGDALGAAYRERDRLTRLEQIVREAQP